MAKSKINNLIQLKKELKILSNPKQAEILQRFFKTGKGEYGEGDIFLGVKVPIQRKVAVGFRGLSQKDIEKLLNSKIHEYRMTALLILIDQYEKADEREKKMIFNFYIKSSENINNWDLVDISAPKIVGDYLMKKPRTVLYKFARSKNLWQRRIAIISTFTCIRNNDFDDTLKISKMFLLDEHDLIHKAVGWMLREVGKRDQGIEEEFLKKYYLKMPRVMLRYAIEKFDEKKRKFYLKSKFIIPKTVL
ncbi:MAG: DNA alkylation repair protein [Patescibacteria group bacterium]|nr:DNA alkylation repair protein [Patescibacteria group bacterium]